MEADYGRFYLSNYQHLPATRAGGTATSSRAAEEPSRSSRLPEAPPAAPAAPAPSALPAAQQFAPARVPAVPSRSCDRPSVIRLAPPPATAAICSVGNQSTEAQVAVIESLIEEKAVAQACSPDDDFEFVGPVAPADDDEEMLLGSGAAPRGAAQGRRHTRPDGVDSESEPEMADDGTGNAPSVAAPRTSAPPSSRSPPPMMALTPPPLTPVKVPPLAVSIAQQRAPGAAAGTGGSGTPLAAPRGSPAPAEGLWTPRGVPADHPSAPRVPVAPPAPPAPGSPADWAKQFGTLRDIDSHLSSSLDRFFSDDRLWERVTQEVSGTSSKLRVQAEDKSAGCRFRVQVPQPYPGVQYRRSKCLDDRYPRYAKHGDTVIGKVEDDGEWLKISRNVFLPMKVGTISILQALPREASDDRSSRWWACGPGNSSAEQVTSKETAEVVVGKEPKAREGLPSSSTMPWEEPDAASALHEELAAEARAFGAAMAAHSLLPGSLHGNELSSLEAATRFLADPINPFSDTPRGGSPQASPLRSRPVSIQA